MTYVIYIISRGALYLQDMVGKVTFHYLIKVILARFLHSKVPIFLFFPFVLWKQVTKEPTLEDCGVGVGGD